MYAFVDTVNSGIVGTNLPTEAMSYNGVYLENEIDGYRTLSVTGRELMESEVTDQEIDGMDGSYYRYKTTPARTITVKYQLRARGSREFRDAFNKMNKLLSGEQVKVIFNDESDKYFIGTKTSNTQVDGGSNNVIGEIEIYCSDPCKYSTTEKEFTATDGVLNIVNEGTVPVSVDYDITTTSETGYIGLVSEEGIMQYGKIVSGIHGAGGEIGHIPVKDDELIACNCGNHGCLEQYVSATGIVTQAKKILEQDTRSSSLRNYASLEAKNIYDEAKNGDEIANEVVNLTCKILAKSLAQVCCVIDPEIIVIGGGVSKAGDILTSRISTFFKEYAFHACENTPIVLAKLENDAGMYGCVKSLF